MSERHQHQFIILHCESALPHDVQSAFEATLATLDITYQLADVFDLDPEAPPAGTLFLTSPNLPTQFHRSTTPANAPDEPLIASLTLHDIQNNTPPLTKTIQHLGNRLNRPGLVDFLNAITTAANTNTSQDLVACIQEHPSDPLAARYIHELSPDQLLEARNQAEHRAQQAERIAADLNEQLHRTRQQLKTQEQQHLANQSHAQTLQAQLAVAQSQIEDTQFALTNVPTNKRASVEQARAAAWRARLTAAQAEKLTEHQNVQQTELFWKTSKATYKGENENFRPHGLGVMNFPKPKSKPAPSYAGEFQNGQRHGYGIGRDPAGRNWIGEWKNNQPNGFGILETNTGDRLEGEVHPSTQDSSAQSNLHTWPSTHNATKPNRALENTATISLPNFT